jgi:hypothetical protein
MGTTAIENEGRGHEARVDLPDGSALVVRAATPLSAARATALACLALVRQVTLADPKSGELIALDLCEEDLAGLLGQAFAGEKGAAEAELATGALEGIDDEASWMLRRLQGGHA